MPLLSSCELIEHLLDVELYVCVNVAKKHKNCIRERIEVDITQLLLTLRFYLQTQQASKPIASKFLGGQV